MTPPLQTFDIFDTVLTRLVGRPRTVFQLVGARMIRRGDWTLSAERFASAREAAERRARSHAFPREVTLSEIYGEMAFAYAMHRDALDAGQRIEVALESELLFAVPRALRLIEDIRRAGGRVGFISDIYLPAVVVRRWLERERLAALTDSVWISSELGSTKASGQLFCDIQASVAPGSDWCHFGDHPVSDVSVPRALGISSDLWQECALSRYEEQMEESSAMTGGVASLLAGASRWLRLHHPAEGEAQTTLRNVAAGVAGPVLWSFVTWVIRTAQKERLRKIWFTARDGQVMLRMARQIASRLRVDVELGYLFGGRQVVHLAGLRSIDDRSLEWLTGGAGVITVDDLLERAGLLADQVSESLSRHGIPRTGVLGWERMEALRLFFAEPDVSQTILSVAESRRIDMQSYFRSCGLIGGDPCAVVDIGWRGSVLRSMFEIMGSTEAAAHRFLYFGLYKRPEDVPKVRMSAYCFDASGSPVLGSGEDIPALTSIMEIFCQADHGQVIHVERRGDDYVPRLRAPPPTAPSYWDVPYFQRCLEAYAGAVRIDLAEDADGDLRPLCESVLRTLMSRPEKAEATVVGSVQYFDDQSGTTSQPFARAYGFGDWREMVRHGRLPHKTLAWWSEGAWALTPPPVRLWLRAARKLARLRRPALRLAALPSSERP